MLDLCMVGTLAVSFFLLKLLADWCERQLSK